MSTEQQGDRPPLAPHRGAQCAVARTASDVARRAPCDIVDLYRQHERRIYHYCMRRLGNGVDAEDATQETFARAAVRLQGLSGEPAAYLSAIAHNVCCDVLDARRRHDRAETSLDGVDRADVGPGPEQTTAERSVLARALHALSKRERALLLHRYAGYSYEETAERLGLTVKVVSVSIVRARQRVRSIGAAGLTGVATAIGLRRLRDWAARRATLMVDRLCADGIAVAQESAIAVGSLVFLVVVPTALPAAAPVLHASPIQLAGRQGVNESPVAAPAGGVLIATAHRMERLSRPSMPARPTAERHPSQELPWFATDQRDMTFTSVTASPSYESDHTVFAAGTITACTAAQCGVVFASRDGGTSWQRRTELPAYGGGPIVLMTGYWPSQTIYAATPRGLQRSDDDGRSFTTVIPVPYAVAAPVTRQDGTSVLLVGSQQLTGASWLYDPATGMPAPGPLLPPGTVADDMQVLGDGSVIAVAHTAPATASGTTATPAKLVRCMATASPCADLGATVTAKGPIHVWTSPSAGDDTIAVASLEDVFVSNDRGQTLRRVLHVSSGQVTAVSVSGGGTTVPAITVAERTVNANGETVSLLQSIDGGTSFSQIDPQQWLAIRQIGAVAILPDGHLLVGISGSSDWSNGMRCSTDGGATWASGC